MSLQEQYNQQTKITDASLKKFNKEIKKVLDTVRGSTIALLGTIPQKSILSYELVWRKQLKAAGYYKLVDNFINKQFSLAIKHSQQVFQLSGKPILFNSDDLFKIKVLKQIKIDFFNQLADSVGLTIKKELFKYSISDASVATMTKSIKDTLIGSKLASYAGTYATTAIGEFQQEVLDIKAPDDSVWVYVGVEDGNTRPFCSRILADNQCYTTSEKDRLANNSERAYNCRHRFYPLSAEDAKEEGYQCQ